jgi:hypothetical protein
LVRVFKDFLFWEIRSEAMIKKKTVGNPSGQGFQVVRVVVCACKREVELYSAWSNECDCGTEYNGFGQKLAPRSQWGEETGEVF